MMEFLCTGCGTKKDESKFHRDTNRVSRKVVYRMYPSPSQEAALLDMLGKHQRLYNAALEQRITAWRIAHKSVGYVEQCRGLTELRAEFPEYDSLPCHSSQATLKRLDLAFQAFFRRVKSGEEPGFPRFKSFDRFSGWGYTTHGEGYRFSSGDGRCRSTLRLTGIGIVKLRGRARTSGEVKTCEIQRKAGRWYASFSIICTPKRKIGALAVGHDWGVETFATIAHEDGSFADIPNPRFFAKHEASVTRAQRHLDSVTIKDSIGRPRNAKDPRRVAAKITLGRAKGREANARKDFLHQTSAKIIGSAAIFATEKLQVSNMIRSAKGNAEKPGKNVAAKAGLNREILATAPAMFLSMMRYKAEEAGSLFIETPTKTLKPSQRCSDCGRLPDKKKTLSERMHVCECGCVLTRDQNGARNNLVWALNHLGREPAGNAIPYFCKLGGVVHEEAVLYAKQRAW
jgi:putative transposase